MPQPGSILGQVTEEFEKIGESVAKEATNVPKDIAGKAMESLGVSSGKKQGQQQGTVLKAGEKSAIEELSQTKEEAVKKAIARRALEELAGRSKPKEPTVRERIEAEEQQKKELLEKQKEQASKTALPSVSSKRKRGDLFGVQAKRASAERKNVRQD